MPRTKVLRRPPPKVYETSVRSLQDAGILPANLVVARPETPRRVEVEPPRK